VLGWLREAEPATIAALASGWIHQVALEGMSELIDQTSPDFGRAAPSVEECWLPNRLLGVRRVAGGGTPTVMIHGLGGSSLNWTDLAYGLEGRLDTWSVDLPGFGASPPPRDGDYSPAGHARAVVELIDKQIQSPVHLFGNSMGGAIALQIAAKYPDRVRSATLISPALVSGRPSMTNIHMPVIAVPGIGERIVARYLRAAPARRVQTTIDTCFASPDRYSKLRMEEAVAEAQRRDRLTYPVDAFVKSLRGLLRSMVDKGPEGPWELARSVQCPTLLVYGRKDKLVDPKTAYKAGNAIPDSRVVVLPDVGHVAQMENPAEVIRYWYDLIDGPHPTSVAGDAELA
jgi:pimeloyl-ACP methyl ester carboxylesterase